MPACDIEAARRDEFLSTECAGDEALRAEVDVLLAQMTGSPTFASPILMPDVAPLTTGSLIAGRYRIDGELGAGGMGRVYRATQLALNRPVAIKVISSLARGSREALARFEREAASVARLRHSHIVTVYDAGADETAGAFYAMELVEGRSLSEELAARGVLPIAEAVEIMRQVSGAVAAAHRAGIIHRDLKPANVMLERSNGVFAKVLDFGLAKLVDGDDEGSATPGVTTSGAVFGTPLYMSPEQARAEAVDARTDVWSLGIMLHRAPGRHDPVPRTLVRRDVRRDPSERARAARHRSHGRARRSCELVDRALRKKADDRLGTAGEFERALERMAENLEGESTLNTMRFQVRDTAAGRELAEPSPARPEPEPTPDLAPPDRASRRTGIVVAIAVGLVLVLAAVFAVRFMSAPAPAPPALPTAVPAPTRSLAYGIVVQKYRNGAPYESPFRLAKEILFEKDYRIRILVSSGDSGSLYVLNEAPPEASAEPSFNILFPSPTTNGGRSELSPGIEVQLPESAWLRFDAERGTELLWLVWSEKPIPELEALTSYINPKDLGAITDPATARAVGKLLAERRPQIEVARDDADKTTTLRGAGPVLVYRLALEHQ